MNEKFAEHDDQALADLFTEKKAAFDALVALDEPTIAQVEEAEALHAECTEIKAEQTERETAAADAAERFAALKDATFEVEASESDPEEEPEDEDEPEAEEPAEEPEAEAAAEEPAKVPAASTRKIAAAKNKRPAVPDAPAAAVKMNVSAEVPGFTLGQEVSSLEEISKAVVNRMRGFTPPSGDGQSEDLQKFGVATLRLPFESEFTIDRGTDDMEVLYRAAKESRLDGESLTAAGGWCAPSEVLYDLPADESLEGILSLPEVQVNRGGIRYTRGPQFADFYANAGFIQTEAQAIAGTTKPCYEVDCPEFDEVRLDAVGVCIKVPILTNAAYPELVQRFTSGTLVAHQHMVNANVIGRMVTLAGAARQITGLGAVTNDTLEAFTLVAQQRRQTYRLPLARSMEVVLPFWVKERFRDDLGRRNGVAAEAVTDQQIDAHFSVRNLAVQYVYDWQDLPLVDDAGTVGVDEANTYPTTFQALIYPAGTFIKGVSDVINLSAVYDAASLAVNTYTGLFMEQGLLVASLQYDADLVELPICASGQTGASDLACA